jgi:putative tryptophan/tyrosine transport system substrate-binding protein
VAYSAFFSCRATRTRSSRQRRIALDISPRRSPTTPIDAAFDEAIAGFGYVERQNLVIDRRYTNGEANRFPGAAAEVVRLKPDCLVVWTTAGAVAVRDLTRSIPIVFLGGSDGIRAGLVKSLARPGGNLTGVSTDPDEHVASKRLQLFGEMIPGLSRVMVLGSEQELVGLELARIESAAQQLHIALQIERVRSGEDLEGAFSRAKHKNANGFVVLRGGFSYVHRQAIADLATRYRLPGMNPFRENVEVGGLMSYGASIPEIARQGAAYVAKVLRGANPGDLPVEQPTKFELVVNLKTAKALGLTIPRSLLLRADQVIE